MPDEINPNHYRGFSNGAQVIDIAERLNFNRGNAIKYIARAGRKPGSSAHTDLLKAKWYLEREIARIETQKTSPPTSLAPQTTSTTSLPTCLAPCPP